MHRRVVLALSFASPILVGCAADPPLGSSSGVVASVSDARTAAALISDYRAANGLGRVTVDSNLNRAAEHQARAVAATGTLSHGFFACRMDAYGVKGSSAENLSAGAHSVENVIARWKRSPGHDANLL